MLSPVNGHELLHAFAGFDLAGVDVPLRVGGDAVDEVELPGHPSVVPNRADGHAGLPVDDPDLVIGAVRHEHEVLPRTRGECQVEHRPTWTVLVAAWSAALAAAGRRRCMNPELRDEFSLLGEDLDPVVAAIANVHETIIGKMDAVKDVELLNVRWRP